MKIIFFGTPPIAAQVLEALIKRGIEVIAVVTKQDKPRGRTLQPLFSAVKELVLSKYPTLPLLQPNKVSTPQFQEELDQFKADLFVVFAYGEIIKSNILKLPLHGCINLHPSLLPKFRGPSPLHYTLLSGEKMGGVTVIEMSLEMDAGDILAQESFSIPPDMNMGSLEEIVIPLGSQLLFDVITQYQRKLQHKVKQDPHQVTFAPFIRKEMLQIKWDRKAEEIHHQVRAFSPAPGAWSYVEIKGKRQRLKILKAELTSKSPIYQGDEWVVRCGEGCLSILELQLEGKKRVGISDFIRGNSCSPLLLA